MTLLRKLFTLSLLLGSMTLYGQTAKLQGKVFDSKTNEPLPFVNIIVDGTNIGSVSDLDGNFIFTGLEPGFVTLRASFVGYKPAISKEIFLTNSNTPYIEIPMDPSSVALDEIVIKVSPFEKKEEAPVSMQKIDISDIETNPGSNRDISKVIQSFPGVAFIPNFRNDIVIRGGGPAENVYYLDDVEIPNINHFATQGASGGAVGIINADLLQSVDLYTGAFPANKGNALSSVFDLQQKEGNKEEAKFRLSVGASETAFSVDGPAGEKSSYLFSVRRSYLQFLFDALGLPFLPTFTDYQLKWKTKFNNNNELKIISIGALDQFRLNTGIEEPDESQEYILSYLPVNEQWSYTFGTVYKHYGNNNFQTLVFSRNMLNNTAYKYPENNEEEEKILDYTSQEIENKLRFEHTQFINDYKLNFSANTGFIKYINDTRQLIYLNNETFWSMYSTDMNFVRWGLSAQASKTFLDEDLLISLGIRADANNYSSSMSNLLDQFSPRVSVKYQISPRVAFSANAGRYFRLPPYTSMGFKNNEGLLVNRENNIRYIGVNHLIAGIEYYLNENIFLSLEGFHKNYSNYPFSVKDSISLSTLGADYGVIGAEEILSIGKGHAYGVELLNRIKIKNRFNFIFAYTYVISEFEDKDGEYVPTTWDSRHLISTTGTLNLPKNWSAGLKWRFSGGLPYTPPDTVLSSLKAVWDTRGQAVLDYDNLNGERLNFFHQLDIRVDKRFFYPKWSFMVYLDIQNLYNFQSESPDFIIREKDQAGNYILSDDGSRYVLRSIENTSGTVLPTIGLMIEF